MPKKKLNGLSRIFLFVFGMAILVLLTILAIDWDNPPFQFNFLGYDVSIIAIASLIIFLGIAGYSLVKSGIIGEWRLD